MEPEMLPLDKALQGLTILALIPVVAYALWADYLCRHLDDLRIKNPKVQDELELEKVRLGSLFVILFQSTLFIGSTEIQTAYPILTQVIFVFFILLQIFVQYRTEKKIMPLDHQPNELIRLIVRVGLSWMAGGIIYLGMLILAVKVAAIVSERMHATPGLETMLLLAGGFVGVLMGFGLNFAFGPIYLRALLPTSPLQDEPLQSKLVSYLNKAKLASLNFRIIEFNSLRISDVLVAGFQGGKGFFRPTLFISRSALSSLHSNELEAIVLNQVSHLVLQHLKKRFFFSLILIISTAFVAISSVFLGQELHFGQSTLEIIAPFIALVSFLVSFKLLAQQARKHELAADLYSIKTLGVNFEHLCNAFRKLDSSTLPKDSSVVPIMTKGHPETELRIELIKASLQDATKNTAPVEKSEQSKAS